MQDTSIPIAFAAGFLTYFSPCILPLIPAYITYITGTTLEEELQDKKLFALSRTLGFVLGFTIIFMIFGILAGFVGQAFIRYRNVLTKIGGIIIVLFGLNMVGLLKLEFLNKQRNVRSPKEVKNWFSSILMGMAFAAGWTPCIGPVLGTILIYVGTTATVSKGIILLLAYSIGLAIPFLLTALLINQFSKFLMKSEKVLPYIVKISGVVIIVVGVLIVFNKLNFLAYF
ncbi:cytochrome c biogenesis CcdA family protein [Caldisalinibacter kiritimatiensis]|uniref:Cytochrome c-type biogenesis protein CcdA (DsbD-like protein) n=1 Tax=Caldisalinibacter kiritimatiensis TaxID=1304284 RepID=R1CD96_9FIRM|nr:cytochrome c biogenesis protein CcdA [Caldisalinibacter kiritimatiensis]EOD00270.1 Cytochrome c-type biogenesis protein CcdA (DsbD -like protein) [Caldisalinibacter kiritimatiensis]